MFATYTAPHHSQCLLLSLCLQLLLHSRILFTTFAMSDTTTPMYRTVSNPSRTSSRSEPTNFDATRMALPAQATQEYSHREDPRFAQEEGRTIYDQLCISSPDTRPTLRTRDPHTNGTAPFTSGPTPFVVYKGEFKQLCHTEHRRRTAFVIEAEYIQSMSGKAKNAAAKRSFLKALDRRVAAGFRHTLNTAAKSTHGITLDTDHPTRDLGIFAQGVTTRILRTFGLLLKSSIAASSVRSSLESVEEVRTGKPRPPDQLAISPLSSNEWDTVMSAGDQKKTLAGLPRLRLADARSNPRVYRIMHDQEVLDTSEEPLRAYWTNADGNLLEINPKDWVTNIEEEDERSPVSLPPGSVAPRCGGDDGDEVDGGGNGMGMNDMQGHDDMAWKTDNGQGSYQLRMPEEKWDDVPRDDDESHNRQLAWEEYLAPLKTYCRDLDNMETIEPWGSIHVVAET